MTSTSLGHLWWHDPLVGPAFEAEPLLAPWEDPAEWASLIAAFADPALYELACGLGRQPEAEKVQELMRAPFDLRLWRLGAASEGSEGAVLVHSRYTTLDRIYVWTPPGVRIAEGVWAAALIALTDKVFLHEPAAAYVFCHLPSPAPTWQEALLVEAGFNPFSVDDDYKPPPREVWGVERQDHVPAGG